MSDEPETTIYPDRLSFNGYPVIGHCIKHVIKGLKPKRNKVPETAWTPQLYRMFDSLKVVRGVLYRDALVEGERKQQLVIPQCLTAFVLRSLHSQMGHLGVTKTGAFC